MTIYLKLNEILNFKTMDFFFRWLLLITSRICAKSGTFFFRSLLTFNIIITVYLLFYAKSNARWFVITFENSSQNIGSHCSHLECHRIFIRNFVNVCWYLKLLVNRSTWGGSVIYGDVWQLIRKLRSIWYPKIKLLLSDLSKLQYYAISGYDRN
jgi:hypothetical protein